MKVNVAINGFGRIGRLILRIIKDHPNFNLVAINDLSTAEDLAYLLKYDSVHRRYKTNKIRGEGNNIIIDDQEIKVFSKRNPLNLPWKELDIDLVFECSGVFTSKEKASFHLQAGAKKVLVSAPAGKDVKTIVYGVNHQTLTGEEEIISAASCTTNCLAPVLKVIDEALGIKKGFMTTVHAYTNDQATLDVPHQKGIYARRGRTAASNIVPTSTGAAGAIGLVIPNLEGKLEGMALRVPVPDGSAIDLVLEVTKKTSKEEINALFKEKQNEVLVYSEEPLVSSDVIGTFCGALVDGLSTNVLTVNNEQLIKVLAWYDNEMGYSVQMVRTALYLLKLNKR
ncbi:MAG: type I glyceraldehyde-3-phosphate dehydrogenase [Bacilli bacterium]